MTPQEFNFIKDSFSQIIDDIAGNPDWGKAAEAVASDLGTLERLLKEKVVALPSNLDEAAEKYAYTNWEDNDYHEGASEGLSFDAIGHTEKCFKAGAEWMAGQFQEIEAGELVDWYSTNDGKEYCCGVKTNDAFEVPEGFYIKKKYYDKRKS